MILYARKLGCNDAVVDQEYRPYRTARSRSAGIRCPSQPSGAPLAQLRRAAVPHLRALATRVRESANLMILVGTEVRFLATVECDQALRVGDRAGQVLPVHQASGGKALLAHQPLERAGELYRAVSDVGLPRLHRELSLVRKRGFAINDQLTERGVTAIGVVVPDPVGQPSAAISLAMPSVRFRRDRLTGWVNELTTTAVVIEHDLRNHATEDGTE
jgi:IclR family transcriptional regulator, acetate operon repressor